MVREKETPLCISWKGSYTVEAAVCLPLIILLSVFILFFCKIFVIQAGIQKALDDVGKILAVSAADCQLQKEELIGTVLGCNMRILQYHVPLTYIQGGIAGISYEGSDMEGNYVDLQVQYVVRFPIGVPKHCSWKIRQRSRNRKWIGWDPNEGQWDGTYVYVTEYGTVYHSGVHCSYLKPSVSAVNRDATGEMRNADGGRYYPCGSCYDKDCDSETVYLTEYGVLYHSEVTCSSLKRNVRRILLEDAQGYHPCKKCAEKGEGL